MKQLPEGWAITNLINIISKNGLISDGDWVESKDQDVNGEIRLIQLADIGDGVFKDKSNRFMNAEKAELLRCTFLKKNDVLIARMPDPLGRACIFPGLVTDSVTVVDVCLVRLPIGSALLNRIIVFWINSPSIRNLVDMQATGTTRRRITRKKLTELEFPIPPLNEQIRIANKLDRVLAKVDATQARLEKIPTLLKRFRQSVLAAATSGELTSEWRNTKKIPYNYVKVSFDNLLIELRNGLSPKPNEEGIGYPILRISSVRSGCVDQEKIRYLECSDKELEVYKLRAGDLLFTRYNGSLEFVGVCGLISVLQHENLLYPDKLIRARLNEQALSSYIEIYFSSPSARISIKDCVKTTSGQKGISGADIKTQFVSLPEIEEQKEIVRRVESLFALADTVEKQYLATKQRTDRLTQSLLAKAFRGELVPQDPNDEPAAELLKRIQAERNTQPPAKNKRSKPA